MKRVRFKVLAACIAPPLVLGAIVGVVAAGVGGVLGLVVAVLGVALIGALVPRLVVRYVVPGQTRAWLRRSLGDGQGSPATARPVSLPLSDRYAAAVNRRDWAALSELTDEHFVLLPQAGHRPLNRRKFLKAARMSATAYPDLLIAVEEVVADPAAPDVAWVRLLETGKPRIGAALHASWWERWTLGTDGLTIREVATGLVVQAD